MREILTNKINATLYDNIAKYVLYHTMYRQVKIHSHRE